MSEEATGGTCTPGKGACAAGAGIGAIVCKGMVLGWTGGLLAVFGLGQVAEYQAALTAIVVGAAVALSWVGFRWAGRKPAVLGVAGILTMWLGYSVSGGLTAGNWWGAEFGPEVWLNDPVSMIPVFLLYLAGVLLFAGAAYYSFGKHFGVDKEAWGVGLAGASVCGGCGLTGIATGVGVAAAGTAAVRETAFYGGMLVAFLALMGLVLYRHVSGPDDLSKQIGIITLGAFVAVPIPYVLIGPYIPAPEGQLFELFRMSIVYVGLSTVFLGIVWAYYPDLTLVPESWYESSTRPEETA